MSCGINIGATTNLRATTKLGIKPVSIIVPDYCIQVKRVLDVAKSKGYQTPEPPQLRYLNEFVQEEKSANIWDKRDLFYWLGWGGEGQWKVYPNPRDLDNNTVRRQLEAGKLYGFSKINLVNPFAFEATYTLDTIANNYRVLLTEKGILKFPQTNTSAYFRTNYNPTTNGIKYLLNDASFTVYSPADFQAAEGNQSLLEAVSEIGCTLWNSLGRTNYAINTTTNRAKTGITESVGYHHFERTSNVLTTYYKNGVSSDSTAAVSTARPNAVLDLAPRQNIITSSFSLGGAFGTSLQKQDFELNKYLRSKLGYS